LQFNVRDYGSGSGELLLVEFDGVD